MKAWLKPRSPCHDKPRSPCHDKDQPKPTEKPTETPPTTPSTTNPITTRQDLLLGIAFLRTHNHSGPGLVVTQVLPHMPAHAAGLVNGDVIKSANGVTTTSNMAFLRVLQSLKPTEGLTIEFERQQQRYTAYVPARVAPPLAPPSPAAASSSPSSSLLVETSQGPVTTTAPSVFVNGERVRTLEEWVDALSERKDGDMVCMTIARPDQPTRSLRVFIGEASVLPPPLSPVLRTRVAAADTSPPFHALRSPTAASLQDLDDTLSDAGGGGDDQQESEAGERESEAEQSDDDPYADQREVFDPRQQDVDGWCLVDHS